MNNYATILLFAYRRLSHVRRTINALRNNELAPDSDLLVYSDGWKDESDRHDVEETREFLRTIAGFRTVSVVERERNYGLGNNIVAGVTETINRSGKVIVLEDDLVTAPFFLKYMNEGLRIYEENEKVISIHGYSYPSRTALPETYFLKGADCLGWATWKRGWDLFEGDGRKLLQQIEERSLSRAFDFDDSYPYTQMLRDQIAGKNTSWAVRWYASAFLENKLTLYPAETLVSHIGYDVGTNFGASLRKPEKLARTEVRVVPAEPKEDYRAREITAAYLRRLQGGLVKGGMREFMAWTKTLSEFRGEKAKTSSTPKTEQGNRKVSRRVRTLFKEWAPPAAVKLLRRFGGGRFAGMRFEGKFGSWEDAVAASSGYDHPSILAKVVSATLRVQRGGAAYERDSVLFSEIEYSWPILSALMWAAALDGGRLAVLDFGGALGSTYFQHRIPLADLKHVRWGVVEQVHYVAEGKANFQDERLRFFTTIEECVGTIRPNVVLLGSALQYVARPYEILASLGLTAAVMMIVDRTPFAEIDDDVITVQRVPPSIYKATYPFRVLSRKRTLDQLLASWRLIATIESPEGEFTVNEGPTFRFDGFLLHR